MLIKKKKVNLLLDSFYVPIIVQVSALVFDYVFPLVVTQPASAACLRTCCALPGGSFVLLLVRLRDNIQELPLEAPLLPGDCGSVPTQ